MSLLVTGRSGSGKTTACNELQKMGFLAYDADRVDGLSAWVDTKTNLPTTVDYSRPIDKRKVGWSWNKAVLRDFLSERDDLILCGSADNQLEFYPLFHKVIFLSLSAEEQVRRIKSRAEHDYGKAPGMSEQIVREQAQLRVQSEQLGAIIMNAHRDPKAIALAISKHIK